MSPRHPQSTLLHPIRQQSHPPVHAASSPVACLQLYSVRAGGPFVLIQLYAVQSECPFVPTPPSASRGLPPNAQCMPICVPGAAVLSTCSATSWHDRASRLGTGACRGGGGNCVAGVAEFWFQSICVVKVWARHGYVRYRARHGYVPMFLKKNVIFTP